jgi:hypothetical protein
VTVVVAVVMVVEAGDETTAEVDAEEAERAVELVRGD